MEESKRIRSSSVLMADAIEKLSNTLLPSINFKEASQHRHDLGNEITSDLQFQMVVYFSGFYFPVWFLSTVVILYVKFWRLGVIYRYIMVAIYTAILPLEMTRIYFGYNGNIYEKVAEIAGSWLIVLLIELPLVLFTVLVPGCLPSPVDYPLHGLLLVFLALHLWTGRRAVTNMAAKQGKMYRLLNLLVEDQ